MGNLSHCYQLDSIIAFIIKKIVNDYRLKSCIFVEVGALWTSGSK
jgi:hypothetical protein